LAVGLSRIRTGDGWFGAKRTPQAASFSVAELGGSDSLLIRPSQWLNFGDPYREFEFYLLRELVRGDPFDDLPENEPTGDGMIGEDPPRA
jgi:hypothetical protein